MCENGKGVSTETESALCSPPTPLKEHMTSFKLFRLCPCQRSTVPLYQTFLFSRIKSQVEHPLTVNNSRFNSKANAKVFQYNENTAATAGPFAEYSWRVKSEMATISTLLEYFQFIFIGKYCSFYSTLIYCYAVL